MVACNKAISTKDFKSKVHQDKTMRIKPCTGRATRYLTRTATRYSRTTSSTISRLLLSHSNRYQIWQLRRPSRASSSNCHTTDPAQDRIKACMTSISNPSLSSSTKDSQASNSTRFSQIDRTLPFNKCK